MENLIFFLGGADAEMVQIQKRLVEAGASFLNNGLDWGAHASAYATEIAQASAEGKTVVLVELDNVSATKTEWSAEKVAVMIPESTIVVDHHGNFVGKPQSILQVLSLLGVEPSREDELIALNDEGYIPALIGAGASPEEIRAIRLLDRSCQGITPEQEKEAERAVSVHELLPNGLVVVRCGHSKTAPVADRVMEFQGPTQNLLILSADGESNFYGLPSTVEKINQKFPGGWTGGMTTKANAFWGGYPNQQELEDFLSK